MDFLNSPYQSESSSTDSHFLPASKKISKTKITRNNSATSPSQKKNYDKTPTKDKEGIMSAIMDELLELRNLDPFLFEHEIMYNLSEWRGYLGDLNHKEFNTILLKVMPKFKPDLTLDQQNLTQLRKKVKGWFDNEKKAETRGGGLVRDEELPELKNVLKKIISDLHKMKTRSFDYLRKQVIPVLEKIHNKSNSRKTKNNMFSKRFWHSFLHKEENADLKALWEGIPKKNAKKSGTAKAQESDHSESDSELTFDVSRKSSGFQEIPAPSCETFINEQHGGALQTDSQVQTLQQEINFAIDFDSLNSQGICYMPDMTSLELTDQSSFVFPPPADVQDVKNCMEEEMFSDTDFTLSENFVTDFNFNEIQQLKNGVKLVNLFKDCENEVQSPIENLLLMQDFDDFNNMMSSSEIQLGQYIGY